MQINKAIIPVAGWGTRRLPITKVIEKAMLPIGNRPLADYVVEDCAKAGVKEVYIVLRLRLTTKKMPSSTITLWPAAKAINFRLPTLPAKV